MTLVILGTVLAAAEDPLFRVWSERQSQGDFPGAMDVLLEKLSQSPNDPGALKRLTVTSATIEQQARELEALAREDRGPAVDLARRSILQREQETRQALNILRASYENKWRTTPESLLHTCRGVELQMQISLPDELAEMRRKEYIRGLCFSLSSGAVAGVLPSEMDIHRVSGFLAYQRMEIPSALKEWKKVLDLDPSDATLAGFVREIENEQKKHERRALARKKFVLAEAKYAAGEYRAALGYYREGLSLDPANRFAEEEVKRLEDMVRRESQRASLGRRLARAREAEARGRREEAVQEWIAVLKADPLNTEARENLARLSNDWGRSVSPKGTIKHVSQTTRDPEKAAEYYSKGLMEYSQGNLKAARQAFERSVTLAPDDEMAARALERVIRQLKNTP